MCILGLIFEPYALLFFSQNLVFKNVLLEKNAKTPWKTEISQEPHH